MSSKFWVIAIILCLVVNEYFVSWLLALFVGNYELIDGFERALKFFSFKGYLLALCFRIIPFIVLFSVRGILQRKLISHMSVVNWCWLIGVVFFIAFGYWDVQYPLYTDAHTSSTSAIAFIFIPIYAVVAGLVSGAFGLVCSLIYRKLRKST